MGKGKGSHQYWAAKISSGNPIFHVVGVKPLVVKQAFLIASSKFPKREGYRNSKPAWITAEPVWLFRRSDTDLKKFFTNFAF